MLQLIKQNIHFTNNINIHLLARNRKKKKKNIRFAAVTLKASALCSFDPYAFKVNIKLKKIVQVSELCVVSCCEDMVCMIVLDFSAS